jgi:hypothetical protein
MLKSSLKKLVQLLNSSKQFVDERFDASPFAVS